jgi:hypothetical protein
MRKQMRLGTIRCYKGRGPAKEVEAARGGRRGCRQSIRADALNRATGIHISIEGEALSWL